MEQVLEAERAVMQQIPMGLSAPGFPAGFWPVIDGDLIPAMSSTPTPPLRPVRCR